MIHTKYCAKCGEEFIATHGNQKLCEKCKLKAIEDRRLKNISQTSQRSKELGVRTTLLYSKDIDLLKRIKEHGDTLADAFHKILEIYLERKEK